MYDALTAEENDINVFQSKDAFDYQRSLQKRLDDILGRETDLKEAAIDRFSALAADARQRATLAGEDVAFAEERASFALKYVESADMVAAAARERDARATAVAAYNVAKAWEKVIEVQTRSRRHDAARRLADRYATAQEAEAEAIEAEAAAWGVQAEARYAVGEKAEMEEQLLDRSASVGALRVTASVARQTNSYSLIISYKLMEDAADAREAAARMRGAAAHTRERIEDAEEWETVVQAWETAAEKWETAAVYLSQVERGPAPE